MWILSFFFFFELFYSEQKIVYTYIIPFSTKLKKSNVYDLMKRSCEFNSEVFVFFSKIM